MTENSPSLQSIAELMDELHAYTDQTVVVKIGGNSIAEDPGFLPAIAAQLEFLQSRRVRLVLVHGGGPQIDQALSAAGIVPVKGADGRRVTDPATMAIVAKVMGDISREVREALVRKGCDVIAAADVEACFVQAVQFHENGDPQDRTGRPVAVEDKALTTLLDVGEILVLNSLGRGQDKGYFNINADDYATAVAVALKARRLILATNVAGVYDAEKKPISLLTPQKTEELIRAGVISGGMIPKVQSALAALKVGVGGVAIIDAHKNWAILGELLTRQGFGTLITEA